MKIYVASPSRAGFPRERAKLVSSMVDEEPSLTLHSTWLPDVEANEALKPKRPDHVLTKQERYKYACKDLEEIRTCDWLWLLAWPEAYGKGAWVEFGYAIGLDVDGPFTLVTGGGRRSIFTAVATHEIAAGKFEHGPADKEGLQYLIKKANLIKKAKEFHGS